jgi:hypothetical protein
MAETLYDGLAHDAVFCLTALGIVRFAFSDPSASGYVRLAMASWRGSTQDLDCSYRLASMF